MEWTVLTDNRSCESRLCTEHGLSILLETPRHKVLLDTGASDMCLHNAETLGIDLSEVDYIFISHGHSDHAGGLKYLLDINQKAKVIVSPYAIHRKFFSGRQGMHSITAKWPANMQDRLILVDHTSEVTEGLHIITPIQQTHPIPKGNQYLFVENTEGKYVNDDFRHELALYADGLLFTGCAHSGMENILAACPWPVHTVVGGFHLLDGQETEEELKALAKRLNANYPHTQFYTSHCTGDKVFEVLKRVMCEQIQPFGCGTHVVKP